jgi:hypothetical protein
MIDPTTLEGGAMPSTRVGRLQQAPRLGFY